MDQNELQNKKEKLAADILNIARSTLLVNMRFLSAATMRLGLEPYRGTIATDAKTLRFNPDYIISLYKEGKEETVRAYLHMILHCLFLHPFSKAEPRLWNLACDIAVEAVIGEWGLPCTMVKADRRRRECAEEIKKKAGFLTAEKIYSYLRREELPKTTLVELEELFATDDHSGWQNTTYPSTSALSPKSGQSEKQSEEEKPQTDKTDADGENPDEEADGSKIDGKKSDEEADGSKIDGKKSAKEADSKECDCTDGLPQSAPNGSPNPEADGLPQPVHGGSRNAKEADTSAHEYRPVEREWKELAERLQTDMETFSAEWGDRSGSMMTALREITREKYNYEEFLKKFAVRTEAMKVNDDEFDYIFYTLGLNMYGNLPLVEPLEYKEAKRIRDFVIAIDTSGSVQGEKVQAFVRKTYNILKQQDTFGQKVNIHIVQCDAEITNVCKISSLKDLEAYFGSMKLYGAGGTDFRPVFEYVDRMVREKEFTNLKGLIYFTDGYGTFPQNKPQYSTAFVFVDDNYNNYNVPPWAIKLVLEAEDLQ